jgi:hypothetical protein
MEFKPSLSLPLKYHVYSRYGRWLKSYEFPNPRFRYRDIASDPVTQSVGISRLVWLCMRDFRSSASSSLIGFRYHGAKCTGIHQPPPFKKK